MVKINWLSDDGVFLPMINDIGRLNFYEAAIAKVANNKTFVDVGAGNGLLTCLAVKYGAKKVYAVERNNGRFNLLCKIIHKLQLNDKVEVIHADFLDTSLSADYCVTETIGSQIFDENILGIGYHAKKLGMSMIPEQIDLSLLVYRSHPIFYLSLKEHLQHTIKLNNRVGKFEQVVSDMIDFDYSSPLATNEYFPVSHALPEIKLETLYNSPNTPFIIGNSYDKISLTLPAEYAEMYAIVNIMWKANFRDLVMDSRNTMWAVPAKRVVIPNTDMIFNYINSRWHYQA